MFDYFCDAFDRRIGKDLDSDADGQPDQQPRYVYDGQHIALAFSGDQATDLQHRYLYGPAIDRILADEAVHHDGQQYVSDEVYWPLVDHLGSVRDVAVCVSGITSVSNHLVYSAFGQVLSETPGGPQLPFAFTGRELDRETGQYYYRARYYDAAVGKFLSEDPIGFEAGDTNLSRYVGNGPANLRDPSGLDELADETLRIWREENQKISFVCNEARERASKYIRSWSELPTYYQAQYAFRWLDQIEHVLDNLRSAEDPEAIRRALNYWYEYRGKNPYPKTLTEERRREMVFASMNVLLEREWTTRPLVAERDLIRAFIRTRRLERPSGPFEPYPTYAKILDAGGEMLEGCVPVCGEIQDAQVLFGSDTPVWQRAIAAGSLAINLFTLGAAPNFGGAGRAADDLADVGEDLLGAAARQTDELVPSSKGLGGNSFQGKSAQQIDDMFRQKGFVPKGPDPVAGKGSYINPETGRKYYIDPGGIYKKGTELPHVDVHRPSTSTLPKKKFPLGDTLIE